MEIDYVTSFYNLLNRILNTLETECWLKLKGWSGYHTLDLQRFNYGSKISQGLKGFQTKKVSDSKAIR